MKSVRVGAGLGFYGDSWRPVRASIERGGVKYIASDHLSELTLAILQKDRQKDPAAGYARDGLPMLAELWPLAAKHGVKFILNAGGLNPQSAREAIARTFHDKGWKATIATVSGDSVMERLDELRAAGEPLAHLDTGAGLDTVRGVFQKYPMIPAMKRAIAHWSGHAGWATVRPPLVEENPEQSKALIADLEQCGFSMHGLN